MELTILMPCLNEAETIAYCIRQARNFLLANNVAGEVLIADNGSLDGSKEIALGAGARVVSIPTKGYGAALKGGICEARGDYVIMGDADASYDFSALSEMLEKLRGGAQLVMGNRFQGGIAAGAMPLLHRYLGNPVLSFIGRLFYKVPVQDFHCGLRGFERQAIKELDLRMDGMEFASEMVVKGALNKLAIAEVPVRLSPDGRTRAPHLRTWVDGWRHLKFLLLFSPRWLFMVPGLALLIVGFIGLVTVGFHTIVVGDIGLDIHTLAYTGAAILLGTQMVIFAFLTKIIGAQNGWLPRDARVDAIVAELSLERILIASAFLFLLGLGLTVRALLFWLDAGLGALDPGVTMRWVVPSVTALALGGELFLTAFFLEALKQPLRKLNQ